MRPWSNIRSRVLLVPVVPAVALVVVVAFNLHRSVGVVAAAVLAVIAAFALAVLVARSITRPLRDLAAIVADTRELRIADGSAPPRDDMLPPRYLHSASPLSDLAIAVAEGRRRAAEIVIEQRAERRSVTDLIANLALRNERLLGAALDALGEISRRDHEPSTAAAIARVHRIVARVDRSTASALVLIGEGGRVAPYPATVTDAVWAAALAIESSDRVDAESLPPATLHADVVADMTHLLAELVDNAVAASPPPARVTVLGEPTTNGGYEITVMDAGGGMSTGDLDEANARVRRLELLHRVPTRHIGLDVVGRLARRHNVVVRLGESADGGVVVRVTLPPSLLTAPAAMPGGLVHAPEPAPEPTWSHSDDEAKERAEWWRPAISTSATAATSAPESWHVAPLEPASAPVAADTAVVDAPRVAPEPEPVIEPSESSQPEPVTAAEPVVVEPESPKAPEPAPEPIAWSIDLTAMEHPTPPPDQAPDEMLPRRGQRKWAAAIARARN